MLSGVRLIADEIQEGVFGVSVGERVIALMEGSHREVAVAPLSILARITWPVPKPFTSVTQCRRPYNNIVFIFHINHFIQIAPFHNYKSQCSAVRESSVSTSSCEQRLIMNSTSPTLRRGAQAARGSCLADCLWRSRDLHSALPLYALGKFSLDSRSSLAPTFTNLIFSAFCRPVRLQGCVNSEKQGYHHPRQDVRNERRVGALYKYQARRDMSNRAREKGA
jgi:hypothetical protein